MCFLLFVKETNSSGKTSPARKYIVVFKGDLVTTDQMFLGRQDYIPNNFSKVIVPPLTPSSYCDSKLV